MSCHEFDNFSLYFPSFAEKAISYTVNGPEDMLVILDDGRRISYNDLYNGIRFLPKDPNELTKHECGKEFGFRLRNKMELKHVTQEELSKRTGISQPSISDYMRGNKLPNFYNADKIAKALNCSIDDFRYTNE